MFQIVSEPQQNKMRHQLVELEKALTITEGINATIRQDVRRIKMRLGIVENEGELDFRCREVVKAARSYYGVEHKDFMSQKRNKDFVLARQCAAYFIHKKLTLKSTLTGRYLGFKPKDHTTVLHSCKQVGNALEVFKRTNVDFDNIDGCLSAIENHLKECYEC